MAQSINQRIGLGGLDEIRRGLANVATEATQSGSSIRAALLNATGATHQFGQATQGVEVSARATRYAIQNLSFQVNDVVTSLASGISPFRTFTQQGGQFVQLFQQGGGIGAVVSGFTSRLAGLVTPTRLAVAGVAALGAGVAALAVRAENSEVATKRFDVQLRAVGRAGAISGKELEDASKRLVDVGLSASEARTKLSEFISAGGDPRLAEKIVRGAEDLSAVLGKETGAAFADAAASGSVAALEGIAKRLNIPINDAIKSAFVDFTEFNRKLNFEIEDAVIKRNRAILENERRTRIQIRDLTRLPGTERAFVGTEDITQRREILVQSAREEENIRRQSQFAINDMLRLAARERNEESQRALEAYNKAVLEKVNEEGEARRLALAIATKVSGDYAATLGPVGAAIHNLRIEWNGLLDALQNSGIITGVIKALEFMAEGAKNLVNTLGPLNELLKIGARLFGEDFANGLALFGQDFNNYIVEPIKTGIYWLNYFIGLAEKTWEAIKNISASDVVGTAFRGITQNTSGVDTGAPNIPARAGGGIITGPGTGTSDSILARVSNGEYIVNAVSTRMNFQLLQAINSMGRSVSAPRRGFAAGGLIGIAPAVSLAHESFALIIEGRNFGTVSAPMKTARDLVQASRTSSIMSAGRAPSWKGTG